MYHSILKFLRKLYFLWSGKPITHRNWRLFSNKEYSNKLIADMLKSPNPCMIARFGSTEMENLVNYVGVKNNHKSYKDFIKGKSLQWWWDKKNSDELFFFSGFFPNKREYIERFCEMMIQDMKQVDLLGSWLNDEWYFQKELRFAKRVVLEDLEPFFSTNPWTYQLEGKKVLVIHPFAKTIEEQYKNRLKIFPDGLLPNFELITIKAVQTLCGEKSEFDNWFEALNSMKNQVEQIDFDIAIIGCGAYGFPLASHIKSMGKKAIHLGGVTQLLFGIIGGRYEGAHMWPYMNLFNEYWVRPDKSERPRLSQKIEDNCYW